MQLAQAPADRDRLHVGVAGHQQKAVPALQKVGRCLIGRGLPQEIEQTLLSDFLFAIVK